MKTVKTVAELTEELARRNGMVGFVPTMGALHPGHLSLVEASVRSCAVTVVSIFVNPTQFNDKEDLANYPRTLDKDLPMLERAGADIVFTPEVEEMYPEEDTRKFDFGPLERVMEGARRPGHFNGVAQIVSRLFETVRPDSAFFGEKDYQQLAIIRELVRQLELPVRIVGCPTWREPDGLAMSSRNILLTPHQRKAAPEIYRAMQAAASLSRSATVGELQELVAERLEQFPELKLDYYILADENSLEPLSPEERADSGNIRAFAAVYAGKVRLIDNLKMS